MRFKMDFTKLPRCGAKARSNNGLPCRHIKLANGRCHYHGGKNKIKHGKYTLIRKSQLLQQRLVIAEARQILHKTKEYLNDTTRDTTFF